MEPRPELRVGFAHSLSKGQQLGSSGPQNGGGHAYLLRIVGICIAIAVAIAALTTTYKWPTPNADPVHNNTSVKPSTQQNANAPTPGSNGDVAPLGSSTGSTDQARETPYNENATSGNERALALKEAFNEDLAKLISPPRKVHFITTPVIDMYPGEDIKHHPITTAGTGGGKPPTRNNDTRNNDTDSGISTRAIAVLPADAESYERMYGHPMSYNVGQHLKRAVNRLSLAGVGIISDPHDSKDAVLAALVEIPPRSIVIVLGHSFEGSMALKLPDGTDFSMEDIYAICRARNQAAIIVSCYSEQISPGSKIFLDDAISVILAGLDDARAFQGGTRFTPDGASVVVLNKMRADLAQRKHHRQIKLWAFGGGAIGAGVTYYIVEHVFRGDPVEGSSDK